MEKKELRDKRSIIFQEYRKKEKYVVMATFEQYSCQDGWHVLSVDDFDFFFSFVR